MSNGAHSKHWRSSRDGEGVCWLTLDKAESGANTLSAEVLEELTRELDALRANPPRGLVLESGKRSGFILGADVNEFSQLRDAAQAAQMASRGQSVLGRIAGLGVPTDEPIHVLPIGKGELLRTGDDVAILAAGSMVDVASRAAIQLALDGIEASVFNARFIKPLDRAAILDLVVRCGAVVTIEENTIRGGFGSAPA